MVVRSTAALLATLAALAAGCGGDDGGSSAAADWATGVCAPFVEWREELRSLAEELQSSSDPAGALRDSGERATAATDDLLSALEGVGPPPEASATGALEALLTGLRSAQAALTAQLGQLDALPPAQASAALGLVAEQVDGVLAAMESSLDDVRTSSEELERAFADAEGCDELGGG
jgi:hypothetical protein